MFGAARALDYAAFFSVKNCYKAKEYQGRDADQANASERLSTQLPYVFSVSRFAHYLKSMMRTYIGNFTSREDCQYFLNNWIANYVTSDATASQAVKAEKPLMEAKIDVEEIPGRPGCFRAIGYLKPHFMLDEVNVSLRLVAELPQAGSGR